MCCVFRRRERQTERHTDTQTHRQTERSPEYGSNAARQTRSDRHGQTDTMVLLRPSACLSYSVKKVLWCPRTEQVRSGVRSPGDVRSTRKPGQYEAGYRLQRGCVKQSAHRTRTIASNTVSADTVSADEYLPTEYSVLRRATSPVSCLMPPVDYEYTQATPQVAYRLGQR